MQKGLYRRAEYDGANLTDEHISSRIQYSEAMGGDPA